MCSEILEYFWADGAGVSFHAAHGKARRGRDVAAFGTLPQLSRGTFLECSTVTITDGMLSKGSQTHLREVQGQAKQLHSDRGLRLGGCLGWEVGQCPGSLPGGLGTHLRNSPRVVGTQTYMYTIHMLHRKLRASYCVSYLSLEQERFSP